MKGDWRSLHASLNKVLNAGSKSELAEAVEELKATGFVEAAVQKLVSEVREGTHAKKNNAARALGMLEAREAVKTLCQAVEKDGNVHAIAALAAIRDFEALPTLRKAVGSNDESVRGTAVEALGLLEASEAIKELIEATQDKKSQVRLAAVTAITKIGDKRGVKALMQRLEDENEFVREYAVEGLKKIGDNRAGEALISIVQNDSSEKVVKNAVAALAQLQDQRAVPYLIEMLEKGEAGLRAEAAWALGAIKNDNAREALKKALKDDSEIVRKNAENALKRL